MRLLCAFADTGNTDFCEEGASTPFAVDSAERDRFQLAIAEVAGGDESTQKKAIRSQRKPHFLSFP